MLIHLSPQRSDGERLTVDVAGDVVTVNGVEYDLGPLEVGASIPGMEIDPLHFVDYVMRDSGGELVMTLIFPHGKDAPYDSRFPLPISVTEDGPVTLPPPDAPAAEGELPE